MSEWKVWITGASGKIGQALIKYLDPMKYVVLATDKDLDVTDLNEVTKYAEMNRPDVIINCAAITGFENCEINQLEAYRVNVLGARNTATAAQRIRAKIIQISTDDVFSGENSSPLTEFDTPVPTTIYGKSKLAAEGFVRELNPKHIIVRSSWVYDMSQFSLLTEVFESAKNGNKVKVCVNQFSSPTSAEAFCHLIITLMESNEYGIFHASCEGSCSRYEFAKKALEIAELPTDCLEEDTMVVNGQGGTIVLENLMLKMTGVDTMESWEKELERYLDKVWK